MSDDFEELEQIPWAALAAGSPSARNRYMAIGVGVVVILMATGWLLMRPTRTAVTSLAATSTTAVPLPASLLPTAPVSPPTTAAVYSEADLMLIDTSDEERLAIMQAEWLVRDFLTVDGDPLVDERIEDILPGRGRGDTPTYVEWARAYGIETIEPGLYRVEVGYRTLAGTADGYVRRPAGAFAVQLAIDVGGPTRLVAGPEPVEVPVLLGPDG